ncbi:hypothetical protein J6590_050497 [Homalodisca vitripennis]|nr:hypothetical protein J6590_050497 [Homalodisca vitripennis]
MNYEEWEREREGCNCGKTGDGQLSQSIAARCRQRASSGVARLHVLILDIAVVAVKFISIQILKSQETMRFPAPVYGTANMIGTVRSSMHAQVILILGLMRTLGADSHNHHHHHTPLETMADVTNDFGVCVLQSSFEACGYRTGCVLVPESLSRHQKDENDDVGLGFYEVCIPPLQATFYSG